MFLMTLPLYQSAHRKPINASERHLPNGITRCYLSPVTVTGERVPS